MLHRTYDLDCSIASTLELVGERWTLLVVRDAFLGVRRFEDFQRNLGIARNVLTDRLARLCDEGILERRPYQERPQRFEYRLTEKGLELHGVLMALASWGDRHIEWSDSPPFRFEHAGCGGEVEAAVVCRDCGEDVAAPDIRARPRREIRNRAA